MNNSPGKGKPLYSMFNRIPGRYDRMNRLLTLSFDERWRKEGAGLCLQDRPERVLDLCTGTGDLALRLARMSEKGTEVHALDFSENMLDLARMKAAKKDVLEKITFHHEDASAMSFPDDYFNSIGIAFAFRNLTFRNPLTGRALKEIYRVLQPGGRFVIMESSRPDSKFMNILFRIYMNIMVKHLGGMISGHKTAYNYLAYSAIHFHTNREIQDMLAGAGFSMIRSDPKLMGAAAVHIAVK